VSDGTIVRLAVLAIFDDSEEVLDRARRDAGAGDPSWQEWIAEHERGRALILRLRTTAEFARGHVQGRVEILNRDVWVENDQHPPRIEEQVREVAYKDVEPLRAALAERGVEVTAEDLGLMMMHVELADSVLERLRPGSEAGRNADVGPLPP
jgi:rhodanese-related sulfurtransferase